MRKLAVAASAAMIWAAPVGAQETLKMATIAPSLGQAITMATFANIVTDNLDDIEIEVSGGGAATLAHDGSRTRQPGHVHDQPGHLQPDVRRQGDVCQGSGRSGTRQELQAPHVVPYGQYHFTSAMTATFRFWTTLKAHRSFSARRCGAYNAARGWVEATTGLVVDEDYDAIKANWQTGFQAFLDGKIDVYVNGCLDPCGQFIQFTETENLRFIGPESDEGEEVDKWLGKWRYRAEVPAGMYDGQKNDSAVMSFDTAVGIGVRADLDEETVYKITKTFWDNLEQVTSEAPWAKALDVKFAASKRGLMELHPGAERYYREVGANRVAARSAEPDRSAHPASDRVQVVALRGKANFRGLVMVS